MHRDHIIFPLLVYERNTRLIIGDETFSSSFSLRVVEPGNLGIWVLRSETTKGVMQMSLSIDITKNDTRATGNKIFQERQLSK